MAEECVLQTRQFKSNSKNEGGVLGMCFWFLPAVNNELIINSLRFIMLHSCFAICSEPVLLFQRDLGRHQSDPLHASSHNSKIPEKVSLKSVKSLKFIKSTKNLSQNAAEPLSPRISLKSIESIQKNSKEESVSFEVFRNPFQKIEKSSAAPHPHENTSNRREGQIKVHFHFEPALSPRLDLTASGEVEQAPLPTISVHNEHDCLLEQSAASSLVFGSPLLSIIREEEKEDLKSTHMGGEGLLVRGSAIKPKSVVSMASSKSDAQSVLLERPINMDKLRTLF